MFCFTERSKTFFELPVFVMVLREWGLRRVTFGKSVQLRLAPYQAAVAHEAGCGASSGRLDTRSNTPAARRVSAQKWGKMGPGRTSKAGAHIKCKDGFRSSTHLQLGCALSVRENSRPNPLQRLHVQAHHALPPVRGCLAKEVPVEWCVRTAERAEIVDCLNAFVAGDGLT